MESRSNDLKSEGKSAQKQKQQTEPIQKSRRLWSARKKLAKILGQPKNAANLQARKVRKNIDGCICIDIDKPDLPLDPFLLQGNDITLGQSLMLLNILPKSTEFKATRRGWHIIITPETTMSKGEILLAQAIICGMIGGDLKREAMNFRRACNMVYLNVLFEPE